MGEQNFPGTHWRLLGTPQGPPRRPPLPCPPNPRPRPAGWGPPARPPPAPRAPPRLGSGAPTHAEAPLPSPPAIAQDFPNSIPACPLLILKPAPAKKKTPGKPGTGRGRRVQRLRLRGGRVPPGAAACVGLAGVTPSLLSPRKGEAGGSSQIRNNTEVGLLIAL